MDLFEPTEDGAGGTYLHNLSSHLRVLRFMSMVLLALVTSVTCTDLLPIRF